jgi:hypothetical protein
MNYGQKNIYFSMPQLLKKLPSGKGWDKHGLI